MEKKTIELYTPAPAPTRTMRASPPYRLRITPTSKFGRQRYYLDNWLPVPAWTRRFDGWTVGAVVRLVLAAMVGAAALMWWTVRLLGRAR